MSQMNATLTTPVPVRLTDDLFRELLSIEDYTGTDKSKLLRLAVKIGLPEVRRRFGISDDITPKSKKGKGEKR